MMNNNKDLALFNIVTYNMLAITREMSADLLRSAYSTVIRESADASTFIADASGRVIAQAQNIPLHLNSASLALKGALSRLSIEGIAEDNVIISNDPYSGGQHQSDIFLFSPVFYNGKLIAYSGSVGHHSDLGHSAGSNLHARDIFEERFRFTPMIFSLSKDWNGGIMEQILRANLRLPKETIGDINAQLVANETGRQRLTALIDRYGLDTVTDIWEQLLNYSEQSMRAAISALPDGIYSGDGMADDDGLHDDPIVIKVKVTVTGDNICVDYEGTSPQVITAINSPVASTVSATYSALKMLLTDPVVPINEGTYRPIEIKVPKGSILNPREFAPVEGRTVIIMRVFQSILKAFEDAIPEKVPAQGYDQRTALTMQWTGDRFYSVTDLLGGGYGAGINNDGADLLDDPLGNCKNSPIEALEIMQPFMRITQYELAADTGGAGRTRGGLGAVRAYEILEDNVHLATSSDRFKYPARGIWGGQDGSKAYLTIIRSDGTVEHRRPKIRTVVNKGDRIIMGIGGGAGYGDPRQRDAALIENDIRNKKVSREKAEELYGYHE